jgi:hypothetical protein
MNGMGGMGGMGGGMMGMGGGGTVDNLLGSGLTAPALQLAVGIFPKMPLYKKVDSVSKLQKQGAKKMSVWYGPLQLPSLEVFRSLPFCYAQLT